MVDISDIQSKITELTKYLIFRLFGIGFRETERNCLSLKTISMFGLALAVCRDGQYIEISISINAHHTKIYLRQILEILQLICLVLALNIDIIL